MPTSGDRKLLFLRGTSPGRIVEVSPTGLSIGRGDENDLVLDGEGISRNHCRIYRKSGSWILEDLESTNGVYLNGERIEHRATLQSKDRIGVCDTLLLFGTPSVVASASPSGTVVEEPSLPVSEPTVIHEHPDGRDEVHAPEPRQPAFPWGRLVVLLVLIAAIVWAAVMTFRESAGEARVSRTAASESSPPARNLPPEQGAEDAAPAGQEQAEKAEGMVFPGGPRRRPETDVEPMTLPEPEASAPFEEASSSEALQEMAEGTEPVLLVIESEPPGASVTMDGERHGKTPAVIDGLAAGRHNLVLEKDGYERLVRQLHLPDMEPHKTFTLRQAAGTVRVESEPPGAAVIDGGQIIGRTPGILHSLSEGTHTLTLRRTGYADTEVEVTVDPLRGEYVKQQLTPVTATLQIRTSPPDCEVRVDGAFKGRTGPSADWPSEGRSTPLHLEGILPGTRVVKISHPPSGTQRTGRVTLQAGAERQLTITLWRVNTEIRLRSGEEIFGLLVAGSPATGLVVAPAPGSYRRYDADAVTGVRKLAPDEAEAHMEAYRSRSAESDSGARQEALGAHLADGDAERRAAPPAAFTRENLEALLGQRSSKGLNRDFLNRMFTVTGILTKVEPTTFGAELWLGPRIQCHMNEAFYAQMKDKVEMALVEGVPVTVQGRAVGFNAGGVALRPCRLKEIGGSRLTDAAD